MADYAEAITDLDGVAEVTYRIYHYDMADGTKQYDVSCEIWEPDEWFDSLEEAKDAVARYFR